MTRRYSQQETAAAKAVGEQRGPVRVLVVDDSAVVRQVMTAILTREPGFDVSTAPDPYVAMDRMRKSGLPDVILLDLEMPRMDGLTFLKRLMSETPIPVVVLSALTGDGTEAAFKAVEAGAVEIVTKPRLGVSAFLTDSAVMLIEAVRGAAKARVKPTGRRMAKSNPLSQAPITKHLPESLLGEALIALGASTGGTEALLQILKPLPADGPGMVVVQHMPPVFTAAFARRLNANCRMEVREAKQGDRLMPGRVLLAPGDRHMALMKKGRFVTVRLYDGPRVASPPQRGCPVPVGGIGGGAQGHGGDLDGNGKRRGRRAVADEKGRGVDNRAG